jgi:uncharacterized protein with PQ loop repeat
VYYCFVDIFLLGQCFYYRGFTLTDKIQPKKKANGDAENRRPSNETTPLLTGNGSSMSNNGSAGPNSVERRPPLGDRIFSVDGTHLSPATPLREGPKAGAVPAPPPPHQSILQGIIFNLSVVLIVCAAGVFGWYLSAKNSPSNPNNDKNPADALHFNVLGQVFGYICAALYLGSRVPQLLLNYRRKGTEGISMLFFLFACIGNLTYVLSIFAYNPDKACKHGSKHCRSGEAASIYGWYILVNLSWLLGSFGTLFLDLGVFVQFFMYDFRKEEEYEDEDEDEAISDPLLADAEEVHVSGQARRRSVTFADEQ